MLAGFTAITALVVGGLGWATLAALELEQRQLQAESQTDRAAQVRLALWRLDGRITPTFAREDSRPFAHYSAVSPLSDAMRDDGSFWSAGSVWLPSPLLDAELPDWMRLHFQVDPVHGWTSPQVISRPLACQLEESPNDLHLINVSSSRQVLLHHLREDYPAEEFFAQMRQYGLTAPDSPSVDSLVAPEPSAQPAVPNQSLSPPPDAQYAQVPGEYATRSQIQNRAMQESKSSYGNSSRNYFPPGVNVGNTTIMTFQQPVEIRVGSLVPVWLRVPHEDDQDGLLALVRLVQVGETPAYQGILLDWGKLHEALRTEIVDLFPEAHLVALAEPIPLEAREQKMHALPLQLEPGPLPEPPPPGWTPLRIGLGFAWLAAIVALAAVGLGGWSLLSLSERRMRFVSAVTHELRTPMTTLRLYLDLLTSGMVRDPVQREEYLRTLHGEADRLHRLIGNVLAFARLEKHQPNLEWRSVRIGEVIERLRQTWQDRCGSVGKQLIVEDRLPDDAATWTDEGLLEQILGNLIDNAQKHTREATDPHIWIRSFQADDTLVIEIEDRGPGVTACERRRLFRAFRRGRAAATTGGVGLGLALAKQWAALLKGRLTVCRPEGGVGACFRVELPAGGPN